MRKYMTILLVAALAATMLAGCGPAFIRQPLPVQHDTQSVQPGTAEQVQATIRMGVGTLEVKAGDAGLMTGEFTYRPEGWKPEVRYSVEGTAGSLTVRQPDVSGMRFDAGRSAWKLGLSPTMPLDLSIELGVGTSKLDLSGLTLKNLHVLSGAGETTLDLTGPVKGDVPVSLESGVGTLVVRVSRQTGVRVVGIHDGVGDMRIDGFHSEGDNAAVNDAWSTATGRLDIRLTRGVGDVRIVQE
jgi:hypothetical protein